MGTLGAEKIRYQLIGMSAAVLQGVPVATIDVDFWLDLPARQMRPKDPAHIHSISETLRLQRKNKGK